ncbi:MAG: hypothetical protein CSB48_14040 [Proteobacteria bacterium]|nr:MAG: hypothetical protein CSB48_14040 [Pseudomonadota bacterium]
MIQPQSNQGVFTMRRKQMIFRWIVVMAGVLTCSLVTQPLYAQQSTGVVIDDKVTKSPSTLEAVTHRGSLRVAVNPDFAPFSYKNEAGKRVGIDIDMATRLANALGVKPEIIVPESFGELIPMLQSGRVDAVMANMSITFERAKSVNFTDPYVDTGISILSNIAGLSRLGIFHPKSSQTFLEEVNAKALGNRLTIAVTEGKAPQQMATELFPQATIMGYPSNAEAAEATLKGDAHLMLHDEIFLKVWLHDNAQRAGIRLRVIDPPVKPDVYGIAVKKGDWEWLQLLNVFVRDLRRNHEIVKSLASYLPGFDKRILSEKAVLRFDAQEMDD